MGRVRQARELSRVDAQPGDVSRDTITSRRVYSPEGSVAWDGGWVWAVFGNSTLARVDAHRPRLGSDLAGAKAGRGDGREPLRLGQQLRLLDRPALRPETFEEAPLKEFNVGR